MNINIIISSVYIQPKHFALDTGKMLSSIWSTATNFYWQSTKNNISGGKKNLWKFDQLTVYLEQAKTFKHFKMKLKKYKKNTQKFYFFNVNWHNL